MRVTIGLLVFIATAAGACVSALPGGTLEGTGGSSGTGAGAAGGAVGTGGMAPGGTVLVKNPGRSLNIAVEPGYVYWAGSNPGGPGGLMKASVSDGQPVPLTSPCSGLYTWVAADSSNVYCADLGTTGSSGTIAKVAIDSGQVTTIMAGTSVNGLAVGPDAVYWTTARGEVVKIGSAGGSPTTLATVQDYATSIAVDGANVYWLVGMSDTTALMKVGASGGDPVELARWQGSANTQIAVDSKSVYWVNGGGALMKVGVEGGPIELAVADATLVTSVAVDGTGVYWTDQTGGVHLSVTPNESRLIGAAGSSARAVALDATHVYWFCSTALCWAPK